MKRRKVPKRQTQAVAKPAVTSTVMSGNKCGKSAIDHEAGELLHKPNSAFDLWLERGLHKLFDEVANEPIPPELLQLIEDDRRKVEDDKTK